MTAVIRDRAKRRPRATLKRREGNVAFKRLIASPSRLNEARRRGFSHPMEQLNDKA
jgi:hypothetical protein